MKQLAATLKALDYGSLPLSDYSRSYILRMLPDIDYYMDIYRRCLRRELASFACPPAALTLVDYGGGHGFLSLAAKRCGVGRVVYVDFNPQAAEAARVVSEAVGEGPDVILTGDAATLRRWCEENDVRPDLVLGMDVIEHIYRLDSFFADLYALNPRMHMLFTTGSTPYNPWVKRRLRRIMDKDETLFLRARAQFLAERFPDMDTTQRDFWASATRGLVYEDILAAVKSNKYHLLKDKHNTCDPATGSWTERILPIADYRKLLQPYGVQLKVYKGLYNVFRGGMKGISSLGLNLLLHLPLTRWLAPFIALQCRAV